MEVSTASKGICSHKFTRYNSHPDLSWSNKASDGKHHIQHSLLPVVHPQQMVPDQQTSILVITENQQKKIYSYHTTTNQLNWISGSSQRRHTN